MAVANPNVTFSIPLRLFQEDKQFLGVNLVNWIWKQAGHSEEVEQMFEDILSYRIVLAVHAYEPVKINLTATQIQRLLKSVFKNAKCLSVTVDYTQAKQKKMLPLIDFELFYKVPA